jgi:short-subunit dehydrogenase
MRDLTDRVIIITGASSGIGAATALACAKAGMNLVINARRADRLAQVEAQIKQVGRACEIVSGDVSEKGISERMLDTANNRFGRFDAVFANAGYGFDAQTADLTEQVIRDMFEVNFFASYDLVRKAAQQLIAQKRPGHLLMCSSCLAKFTLPGSGLYCATKAAQNHICRSMNIELRDRGIFASSVHPVGTRTEFFEASAKRSNQPSYADKVLKHTPRFLMQPAERVANAVVRCLRRPKPEVWTSHSMRVLAGMMMMWPTFGDFVMRRANNTAAKRFLESK